MRRSVLEPRTCSLREVEAGAAFEGAAKMAEIRKFLNQSSSIFNREVYLKGKLSTIDLHVPKCVITAKLCTRGSLVLNLPLKTVFL